MKKYFSHFTAAYHWNIPHLNDVLEKKDVNRYQDEEVVEITVTEQSRKYKKQNHIIHACELPLPRGAVVWSNESFVASPELVFLDLANNLDIHRLILLGLQMCSHPPGNKSESVTTKRKLSSFLEKTRGFRGHEKAEYALQYIENGSASFMESMAFMILTLPHKYGGFGLKGACFNYEIEFGKTYGQSLRQKRCFVDLFYSQEKLAVEYDSFAYHHSPSAQSKDLLRATAIERQRIEVMRFSTIQLYDEKACREFAQNLAVRLGRRIRIRTPKFHKANNDLRDLLPSRSQE